MTALAAPVTAIRGDVAMPAARPLRVALVGNPNCGKSTLFNALTGRRQRVANYPGVTVERVEGTYVRDGASVTVLDLPGTYSLSPDSPDEAIALDVVHGRARGIEPVDVIVVVLDAENLERHLFLATQVLELGLPAVLVLNRSDRLAIAGMSIDVVELMHTLGRGGGAGRRDDRRGHRATPPRDRARGAAAEVVDARTPTRCGRRPRRAVSLDRVRHGAHGHARAAHRPLDE